MERFDDCAFDDCTFDYCIVGAGVIGLAIAHKLSQSSPNTKILLIEKNHQFGSETSSRNSEVIHAGIYYPPQSLKAELCRQGKEQLFDFCKTYSVPYKPIGKLIIASQPEELAQLEAIYTNAADNQVELQFLKQRACTAMEPQVNAIAALYSPSTGIIDSHSFMQTLLTLSEQQGVLYSPNTHFKKASKRTHGFGFDLVLDTADGEFHCVSENIINCAGLWAPVVAHSIETFSPLYRQLIPEYHFCRGHYYSYAGKPPFKHLIYPVPDNNTSGLGIHATLDLSGQVRFGPDTEYINSIDYSFDPSREEPLKDAFSHAIKRYFPALNSDNLHPSYTGIRPKLSAPNTPAQDFIFQGYETHGITGLMNLLGMESPGLTASLAIADKVVHSFNR